MMKKACIAAALFAAHVFGQGDAERQFEAALHREVVAGDLKGAIESYRALLALPGAPRGIAARALLHIGECYERLGQRAQAHDAYTRLTRDFDSEPAAAAAARARLELTEVLPGPRNLNFEKGEPGKVPAPWFVPSMEKTTGNLAELRRKDCRSGIGCVVLIAPATSPDTPGRLMQSFSAAAYRGKTVRLRAWLKVEAAAPGDRAQLSLKVTGPNQKTGFWAERDQRAEYPARWTICEITGKIDDDAQFVDFWIASVGHGSVWIDNVSFEVVSGPS
jgi:hypothetical protein